MPWDPVRGQYKLSPEEIEESKKTAEKRQEELTEEGEARRTKTIEDIKERGYGKEEREEKKQQEKQERLEAIERGEIDPTLRNAGGMWKREYDKLQAERKEREEARYAADPESRPKGFKEDFAERRAARRERDIASAEEKRQKREKDQQDKLTRVTQNATINAAVRRGSLDKDTKKTLDSLFGRGIKASTRNKVDRASRVALRPEVRHYKNMPKDRQEGSRDLVNRLINTSESSDILGTEQGKKWLETLSDDVAYAPEGDDNYGLRIPSEESYKENQEIWNQVLSPEEKKALGDTYQEIEENETRETVDEDDESREAVENESREAVDEDDESREFYDEDDESREAVDEDQLALPEGARQEALPEGERQEQEALSEGTRQEEDDVIEANYREVTEGEQEEQLALDEGEPTYTDKNFGRTTVREEQNQALKELSEERVINSQTQEVISSFINNAGDKNAARNELQQHMEEFGTDREKWSEWAEEQQAGQKNFSRMPVRGRQDKAIADMDEEAQTALIDIIDDADDEAEARGFIQRLMDEFGSDSSQWNSWLEQYQQTEGQAGAYENALNISEGAFASSGDGEITKFAKGIVNRFDSLIKSFSPKPEVVEEPKNPPSSFFYKEINSSDLVINDKANHVVKGLDDFIEIMDVEKPPLSINLFKKQVASPDAGVDTSVNRLGERRPATPTASQASARPSIGHKGVPGKWSGSHLVPMYRTVHRKVPRELILRAIRWVNPKNFFTATNGKAITDLSDDEWREMDRDELIKNITTLNEYREESLVISNRYSQMIALIDQGGQTPYSILWNDPDKWMTLTDRLDRAKGLKEGTAQWENQLDKTSLQLRKILGEEQYNTEDGQKSHFGMIDELFDEEKGRIPFFKDPTKGQRGETPSKDDRPWLRKTRGTGRFGEPEEDRRVIAEDAEEGIRAARYQLPSRRETLNPTEQEVRSDEFMEIMRQAPIYQGIRMPSEEQLRAEGRFEMSPETIREIAPTYSRPEESPFLRTVNNPLGRWQEEAGVDASMVRSTRFVAESLNLTRTAAEEASQRRHDTRVNAYETRTRQGLEDMSQEALDVLNPQALTSLAEQERWFNMVGQLLGIPHTDPPEPFEAGEVILRVPSVEDGAENANLAWTIDRELHLNSSPTAHLYSHEGNDGYLMENKVSVDSAEDMMDDEVDFLFNAGEDEATAEDNITYRKSFYKMMLLDVMCGNKMGQGANIYSRTTPGMGFDEAASDTNQWHGVAQENYFSAKDRDGSKQLFPWNIFEETAGMVSDERAYGFEGNMLPVEMPDGYEPSEDIDYETEITEVIEEAMPTLNADADDFNRTTSNDDNDDLWFDLANRIGTAERYEEFKTALVTHMREQMQDPTLQG